MDSARWRSLVAALSVLPVLGAFTTTRIFFVRDLSFFFWSRHLWLRHAIFSGQAPWWDPYVAAGQSAIADALNQVLMPITLALRLLPSDVVSFNAWVALPLPIAALGMFAWLRRRVPDAAAATGACIFALSGPIVSTLNTPNLSWSVALIPWVFWSLDRGGVAIAIAFALQALCGEPVTWVATGVLAGSWILASAFTRKIRLKETFGRLAYLAAGGLLAAAQLIPTLLAGVRAHRAAAATPDFWSLHPVALWDAVAPNVFGNYYDAFLADLPWMGALNFGREPFFYSLYVGPIVLLLAVLGVLSAPRRHAFWIAAVVTAVLFSLGGYSPVYPFIRTLVPPLMYFRFPVKYLVIAVFGLATLAAEGMANIRAFADVPSLPGRISAWTTVFVLSGIGLAMAIAAVIWPESLIAPAHWLASSTHLKDPEVGAAFLARTAPPLAARFFALLIGGGLVVANVARVRHAALLLAAATVADLAMTHAPLNITMDLAKLSPPAWFASMAGPQRLYIGGRARGYMNKGDPDAVSRWQIPAEATAIEGRMELNAQLPMAPSGWGVREALSYDLPVLWPAEYEAMLRRFEDAGADERVAFLRRSGVRRCVLPDTGPRPFPAIADVPDWNMRVFECNGAATRTHLASTFSVATDRADVAWQHEGLFDLSVRDDVVRLDRPLATGLTDGSAGDEARIVSDLDNSVTIEVSSRGGILVLRDTYDPSWRATVDGAATEIARANGAYRAVAVPPGRHVVRFSYRPRDFINGLMVSVMTAIALLAVRLRSRSSARPRAGERGFTLIELMIVLAVIGILLGIAFNQYRGMQAKGNEASAMGSLRSIATAQWQFASVCANGKYSATLTGLGQPVPATGHPFLSPDLTQGETFEKSGYTFLMAAKPLDGAPPACNGATVAEAYAVTADPTRPGVSGSVFYAINADRLVYADEEATFKENMPETGPPGHGTEVK